MKLWVAVTDHGWFEYLRARNPDEVNFWQPSGHREFRVLDPGELFLFKLHSPQNYIVGGGFFVRYSALPCSLAWEAFGDKNGVRDQAEFLLRIRKYRSKDVPVVPDPVVGCNILVQPFFFPEKLWIPVPRDWSRNIVQGKTYDSSSGDPVTQARAQARWIRDLIAESTGRKIKVRPVVVYPGWWVECSESKRGDVWVLNPKALPAFIAKEPACLKQEDVHLISSHLGRFVIAQQRAARR